MNTQTIIERFNEYTSQGDVFCQEMLKSIKKDAEYDKIKPEESP